MIKQNIFPSDVSFTSFKDTDKYDNLPRAIDDYKCPCCGKDMTEFESGYEVDCIKYPIRFNEIKGSNMDGNYWDWEEMHVCPICNTEFVLSNGIY
jgi:hypothetical protein